MQVRFVFPSFLLFWFLQLSNVHFCLDYHIAAYTKAFWCRLARKHMDHQIYQIIVNMHKSVHSSMQSCCILINLPFFPQHKKISVKERVYGLLIEVNQTQLQYIQNIRSSVCDHSTQEVFVQVDAKTCERIKAFVWIPKQPHHWVRLRIAKKNYFIILYAFVMFLRKREPIKSNIFSTLRCCCILCFIFASCCFFFLFFFEPGVVQLYFWSCLAYLEKTWKKYSKKVCWGLLCQLRCICEWMCVN